MGSIELILRFLIVPGGFSFNQYLIVDDEPLLFHTGLRRMFPLVRPSRTSRTGPLARWLMAKRFRSASIGFGGLTLPIYRTPGSAVS